MNNIHVYFDVTFISPAPSRSLTRAGGTDILVIINDNQSFQKFTSIHSQIICVVVWTINDKNCFMIQCSLRLTYNSQ